jgi:hypothetical protein
MKKPLDGMSVMEYPLPAHAKAGLLSRPTHTMPKTPDSPKMQISVLFLSRGVSRSRKRSPLVRKARPLIRKSLRRLRLGFILPLEDKTAFAADVEQFLWRVESVTCWKATVDANRALLTMPVSDVRCWDWKKTASSWSQLGQGIFARGS